MIFDLNNLVNNKINIEEKIELKEEDLKKVDILKVNDCTVKGTLRKISEEAFEIDLNIVGTMMLECALSLEEVEYPFNININKTFGYNEENDENLKIVSNTLDIFPIIWENIVLERPSRIVKKDSKAITKGEGWSLVDEVNKDYPLSEMSKLLDMEE
ncbi:MAG: DUF177 domain-containing protein [Bacilli bacterium]|nr:DUF177 domain-containing protein [Bacilli bacterium]MBQ9853886.1 DUF177 domain-containing protein [Bacilli bacterium]